MRELRSLSVRVRLWSGQAGFTILLDRRRYFRGCSRSSSRVALRSRHLALLEASTSAVGEKG